MTMATAKTTGWRLVQGALVLLGLGALFFVVWETKPWQISIYAQLAEGSRPSVKEFKDYYLWWGMLISFLVIATLLMTMRWWMRPCPIRSPLERLRPMPGAWFWAVLALIILVALLPRLPRMDQSLWGDEEWSLRLNVAGEYRVNDDGELELKRKTWLDVLWGNPRSNNHFLFSILQKISLDAWRASAGVEEGRVNEVVARWPALVAGLLSLPMAALLLARWGWPMAGLAAALFLALHPFHVRYSVEARGYGLVLLLMFVVMWLAWHAVRDGRWRVWLAYAAAQFLLLYSWPGIFYFLVVLNLGLFAAVFIQHHFDEVIQAWRWAVANCVSVVLAALFVLPGFMQILVKLDQTTALKRPMGWAWVENTWGQLMTGMNWRFGGESNELMQLVAALAERTPWIFWYLVVLAPLLILAGLGWIWWRDRLAGFLVTAPLAAFLLMFLHMRWEGNFLLAPYALFTLPSLAIGFVVGAQGVGMAVACLIAMIAKVSPDARLRMERGGGIGVVGVVLALYAVIVFPCLGVMCRHSMEPLREIVEFTRAGEDPFDNRETDIITASLWRRHMLYDPRMQHSIQTREEIRHLVERARQEGKTLFVIVGHERFMRGITPEPYAVIADSGEFEPVAEFPGLMAEYSYTVYQWRGADRE